MEVLSFALFRPNFKKVVLLRVLNDFFLKGNSKIFLLLISEGLYRRNNKFYEKHSQEGKNNAQIGRIGGYLNKMIRKPARTRSSKEPFKSAPGLKKELS